MSSSDGALGIAMSGRASSAVLVGRSEQMAALEGALDSVRQGGPAAVLLGGEAGVGKSRLISEFATIAQRNGARVLTGGCMQLGPDGLPFAPFTAVLRDLVHEMGTDAFGALLPGRATRELARLLPEVGATPEGSDSGTARARLFEEMLSVLDQLGNRSPVVLIIEDAHWADRSSRDLLTFLIGNQRTLGGVLVLVSYRSDELHRTHPLRPLLATLDRIDWVSRVDLPGLSRAAAVDLASRILGHDPSGQMADVLYRRTNGNPLFIEALLCCDGEEELTCEVPESLRDLLLESVHRLPDDTQELLRTASSNPGVTSHALLAAVTGLDDTALSRVLRPAVTANVLRAEAAGYAFRHELIREAVHEDLLPGEHGRLHSKFAEAIDADNRLVPPGRAAIEMAFHWNAAHDATWALIAAWQAAAQAGKAVAPAERLSLLARVLELWDQVPDAASRISADHVRVLEEATAAAHDADEWERGIALASSALKELDAAAEPVRTARLLEQRGRYRMHSGRYGSAEDFDAGLRLVPGTVDVPTRVKLLLSMARCIPFRESDRSYAEEALALARSAADKASEAKALLMLAMFDGNDGQQASPGSGPIELISQARALGRDTCDLGILLGAAINESHLLEGAGDHSLAFEAARAGVQVTDAHSLSRTSASVLTINQAEPLVALGRWDEAMEVLDGGLDVEILPRPSHRALLQILKGTIALSRGDTEQATRMAKLAESLLRDMTYKLQNKLPLARLQILLALASSPAAGVAATARALDDNDLANASPRYAWPVLTAGAAAGVAAASDDVLRNEVVPLLERLRAVAEKLAVSGPLQQAHQLTFAAADATVMHPGGSEPLAAWDAAFAAWQELGEPFAQAETLLRAAECALAGGDKEAAGERLRRAASAADELGARPLAAAIAALARRARIVLGSGSATAPGPDTAAGLTDREVEVLRLVAAGRSNREIAAELFMSPKTASVHVSNILRKLGAGSRTEAAAKARSLGVVG
jgi:DNA-binding CsgD family transcriptional regulator